MMNPMRSNDPGGQDRRLEQTPVTRRVVAGGAIAIALGAAWRAAGGLAGSEATAASLATTASDQPDASPAASPTSSQIVIENFTFTPDVLTVPVGTEVTWENLDDIPHTVTSEDKTSFSSGFMDTGDRFTFRFTTPGTYPYFCSVHPMMTAKIIVEA
jgi:plastocyanin